MKRAAGAALRLWVAAGGILLAGPPAITAAVDEPLLVLETEIFGEGEGVLRWPNGVAAAAEGEIVATDLFGGRLIVFHRGDEGWKPKRTIHLDGAPAAVVALPDRYLVGIRGVPGLTAIDREHWQLRRVPLPEEVVPGAMAAVSGGAVLIHDAAGGRFLFLAESGSVTARIPVPGLIRALAAAPGEGFFAAVPAEGAVETITAAGTVAARWIVPGVEPRSAWPAALLSEPDGDLLVLDRHGGRVVFLDARGRPRGTGSREGRTAGLLHHPSAMAWIPTGRIAIADQGNGRVQIFRVLPH